MGGITPSVIRAFPLPYRSLVGIRRIQSGQGGNIRARNATGSSKSLSPGAAIFALYRHLGEEGAAITSTVAAVPLIGMQLLVLNRAKILRSSDALTIFRVSLAGYGALGLVAWSIGQ